MTKIRVIDRTGTCNLHPSIIIQPILSNQYYQYYNITNINPVHSWITERCDKTKLVCINFKKQKTKVTKNKSFPIFFVARIDLFFCTLGSRVCLF